MLLQLQFSKTGYHYSICTGEYVQQKANNEKTVSVLASLIPTPAETWRRRTYTSELTSYQLPWGLSVAFCHQSLERNGAHNHFFLSPSPFSLFLIHLSTRLPVSCNYKVLSPRPLPVSLTKSRSVGLWTAEWRVDKRERGRKRKTQTEVLLGSWAKRRCFSN